MKNKSDRGEERRIGVRTMYPGMVTDLSSSIVVLVVLLLVL